MPIIWITISFFTGVISADSLDIDRRTWVLAGLLVFLTLLVFFRVRNLSGQSAPKRVQKFLLGLILAFLLGGIRFQSSLPDLNDPDHIFNYADIGFPVFVTGVITNFPDQRDQIINLEMKAEVIRVAADAEPVPVRGKLLAKIPAENQVCFGDRVTLAGFLSLPPDEEDFSYRDYLKRKGIYVYLPQGEIEVLESNQGGFFLSGIYSLRSKALSLVYQLWPDPEASLLAGILLGIEAGIPDDVGRSFRETGTTHIIAISGFNITIVAGLFSRIFGRLLNPRRGALAAILGIGIYTLLVGGDAAVLRAAIMGGCSILAHQIGRRQHGINAAALASLIMIIFNPQLPWDISFQLSLSATMGLILYADLFSQKFFELSSRILPMEAAQRITQPVSEYFLFTFAAQITTFPVMLFHFHSFSISTFLTNPAILPVQPPIMILGGLAVILGMIWDPLGRAAAPLVYPFVLYTIRAVEWFARFPIRSFHPGQIGLGWVILIYGMLLLLTYGWPLVIALRFNLTPSIIAAGLGVLLILIWRSVFVMPDGRLHIFLLDIGTGNGIYIRSPSGSRILINGGPSTRTLSDELGRLLPPFQRDLDYLIVSSPQEQDIDSLAENIPRFLPEQVFWLGSDCICYQGEYLMGILGDLDIQTTPGKQGQVIESGDGVRITVLTADQRGGSLLLEYRGFRALFPFGLREEEMEAFRMGRDLGQVTVLLLGDNGFQSSNPQKWIQNLDPRLLLLSVGNQDSRGLPDPGLLDRLAGQSLLRTDQHGRIEIITDGKKMWIQVEKPD
jgi:competence protein ComEC